MKRIILVAAIVVGFNTLIGAMLQTPSEPQSAISGTWQTEPRDAGTMWKAVLRTDGRRLIGAVSSCASIPGAFEIADGKIDGTSISFKCTSYDGDRTLTFTGTVSGDDLHLTWVKHVREGGMDRLMDAMFGESSPRRFVVRRAPETKDAVTDLANSVEPRAGRRHVTFQRILDVDREPQNWLTYSGNLLGWRHSPLTQITPANVKDLELAWLWQAAASDSRYQATSIVADGILYTVGVPNDVVALDAATGRVLWKSVYAPHPRARASGGGGRPNRGVAVADRKVFLGTLDAHLVAFDAYTGTKLWDTEVANSQDPACKAGPCYVITHAPLIIKDKVVVGVGGGEGSTRGFISAFDVATGKEVWRFHTIPAPGEPGHDTWAGDSWKTGGAAVWNTGSYDPALNLTYWGIGNPYPPYSNSARQGDNLYSNSVVALDVDSGALKWHYQFTPQDDMDWDSAQVPVLVDMEWAGRPRRLMLWANRNGLFYVLDRATGEFLRGMPFVEVNWMKGFDAKGRPIRVAERAEGPLLRPGLSATNWWPPSYSPRTGLFYIAAWERGAVRGGAAIGGPAYGVIRALDPRTGTTKWEFRVDDGLFSSGVLTTASGLVFAGIERDAFSARPSPEAIAAGANPTSRREPDPARLADGYFYALESETGRQLWRMSLAGSVTSGPVSYSVNGRQYVAIAAGNTLFGLALRR